ncbi:hypothetical protein NEOLEDRAFT_1145964 [Neolentinus lepideus HHB14362 ss-1]|uniref:Uncharacterized protein n=1 Tax=Neolentinus lepideus HHB14362 ss-1 TaxID=1314782 RepID=A0A165ULW3_9AGAM|nr:hypothetical protein NEOLEDRAFT_1145964 [Neolentinus lepideus HHB14362 ss-1]
MGQFLCVMLQPVTVTFIVLILDRDDHRQIPSYQTYAIACSHTLPIHFYYSQHEQYYKNTFTSIEHYYLDVISWPVISIFNQLHNSTVFPPLTCHEDVIGECTVIVSFSWDPEHVKDNVPTLNFPSLFLWQDSDNTLLYEQIHLSDLHAVRIIIAAYILNAASSHSYIEVSEMHGSLQCITFQGPSADLSTVFMLPDEEICHTHRHHVDFDFMALTWDYCQTYQFFCWKNWVASNVPPRALVAGDVVMGETDGFA